MKSWIAVLLIFVSISFANVKLDAPIDFSEKYSLAASSEMVGVDNEFTKGKTVKPRLPGIFPFVEVILQNIAVWSWDRFALGKDYAKTGPSIWRRNLREGWEWDNNHWAINFFGHPYQGSYYHVAARASGMNFYQSLFFSAFGSWSWEYFGETEYPSINDFFCTSIGGSLYGEMLFRLSHRLLAKPNPTWFEQGQSFVLHPFSFLHWKVDGLRPNSPGYEPLEMTVFIGLGSRFGSDYRYDKLSADRLDNDWREFFGYGALSVVYGYPNRKLKAPVEYFTVDVHFEQGEEERLFFMNASGKLHNYNRYARQNDSWLDIALYLDFDSFYGDLVQMGNISLGLGLDIKAPISDYITMRYITKPGIIIIGSADFNYNDLLKEIFPDYEATREYQYNYGAKYMTSMELAILSRYYISDRFDINIMKTYPNSEPHYGAKGFDVVGTNSLSLKAMVTKHYAVGIQLDTYFKIAAYTGELFKPMSRFIHTIALNNSYSF